MDQEKVGFRYARDHACLVLRGIAYLNGRVGLVLIANDLIDRVGLDQLAGAEIALGDFDDDGYDDLLVGAPNDTSYGSDRGTAYVVYGPYSGDMSLSSADAELASESTYDYAGWGVAAGDIDNDGVEDVLVGAPYADSGGSNSGSAYLVLGPVSGFMYLTSADAKFVGEAADDKVGEGDLAVGDLNGAGGTDMILSAHEEDSGGSDAGAVYLIFGGGL